MASKDGQNRPIFMRTLVFGAVIALAACGTEQEPEAPAPSSPSEAVDPTPQAAPEEDPAGDEEEEVEEPADTPEEEEPVEEPAEPTDDEVTEPTDPVPVPLDCVVEVTITGHGRHEVVIPLEDVEIGDERSYDMRGGSMHTHSLVVTAADFQVLATGESVTVVSGEGGHHPHTHEVTPTCVSTESP